MSTYQCAKGHESTESDYCSECGVKIHGGVELLLANNSLISTVLQTEESVIICPDCTAPHEPDSGDFCEICGYNFVSGAHGEIPIIGNRDSGLGASENKANIVNSSSPISENNIIAIEVIATIDPSIWEKGSPPPPSDIVPITFRLDKSSSLIGRSSNIRGIYPDIPIDFDDAVSHRHGLINRQDDGTVIIRDIGSTNGTKLNGIELAAMVDTPIKDGDEVTLGHWTRLSIKFIK
jgi:FHA domain